MEVEKIIGRGSGFVAVEIPFTPRAKRVLELSLEEARQLGGHHLLCLPGLFVWPTGSVHPPPRMCVTIPSDCLRKEHLAGPFFASLSPTLMWQFGRITSRMAVQPFL